MEVQPWNSIMTSTAESVSASHEEYQVSFVLISNGSLREEDDAGFVFGSLFQSLLIFCLIFFLECWQFCGVDPAISVMLKHNKTRPIHRLIHVTLYKDVSALMASKSIIKI